MSDRRRFLVFYRRRNDSQKRLRVGLHVMPGGVTPRQFRIDLVGEYNRTNKRVVKIEHREGGLEKTMNTGEKVDLLKHLKRECVKEIRSREPDAATPDGGVDEATVQWVAGVVERWFGDRIFEIESS